MLIKKESTALLPVAQEAKEAYWQAKDNSQKVGGIMHDAASVTQGLIIANALTEEQALRAYERVLKRMIEIREAL